MILGDVIKIDERFQTSVNIRFDIDKINVDTKIITFELILLYKKAIRFISLNSS